MDVVGEMENNKDLTKADLFSNLDDSDIVSVNSDDLNRFFQRYFYERFI